MDDSDDNDPSDHGPLLPYSGGMFWRRSRTGAGHLWTERHNGRSFPYQFNSLGYRGEEFDPNARLKVFALGCSHAFGTGLGEDEMWTRRFVEIWRDQRGARAADVTVMNFGESGGSSDYLLRTLIGQCTRLLPDLVLMNFPDVGRSEMIVGSHPIHLGKWVKTRAAKRRSSTIPKELRSRFAEGLKRGRRIMKNATYPVHVANTLRNILLAQCFCRVHGLPAVASLNNYEKHSRFFTDTPDRHPILAPIADAIDATFLCDFSIDEIAGNRIGSDGFHYSASAHEDFGRAMYEFFARTPR